MTQDMNVAKDIATRHGFDLVAICTIIPMSYDAMRSRPMRAPMLIETLKEGNPPDWLREVPTGVPGLYKLFKVDKGAFKETH